jgi:hypothetical protein
MARILKDFAALEAYLALRGLGSGGRQHGNLGTTSHGKHS